MGEKQTNLKRLTECGVVAVIRANSMVQACDLAAAVSAGGIVGIEILMGTPEPLKAIEQTIAKLGDRAVVGAGSVISARDAKDAIAAGAQFIVSPALDAQTFMVTSRSGVLSIPGAFSPGEILLAHKAGADVTKVFPSRALGPAYFRDILAPMPHLKLMPTGGVTLANLPDWLAAGALMAGVATDLFVPDAVSRGDWKAIEKRAGEFVAAAQSARRLSS